MTLWKGSATSENMLQTCKNCGHRGDYHLNVDLQRCMKHGCVCNQFDPAYVEKETLYIPVEKLLFKPNAPAGMNHLVVMSLTYFFRSSVEDSAAIVVKREGDNFRIQDGRHRVVASMMAGRPTVLATIEED